MQKNGGDWRFCTQQLPSWVSQHEGQLSYAIEDELEHPTPLY
jgi:hypothetical protein